MKYIIILFICFLVINGSCSSKKEGKDDLSSDSIQVNATYTYLSDDGMYLYELNTLRGEQKDNVILVEKNFKKHYSLKQSQSAKGIEYRGAEGYRFLTYGDEFIFYEVDEKISSGKLVKTIPEVVKSKKNTIYGTYVSEGYLKKSKGNDWVAIILTPIKENKVKLSVRSRADRKIPTCTFDGQVQITGRNQLKLYEDGIDVTIKVDGDSLSILPQNKESADRLYFYCNGGSTLSGKYSKINGKPDSSQIDNTQFFRFLNYGDYAYSVTLKNDTLKVFPIGLELNDIIEIPIQGDIKKAEIGDLNEDGYPELVVFEVTRNTNNFKKIHGFSINKGKSFSITGNLPDITDVDSLAQGYRGEDEFSIVENTLVRRFPVYKETNEEYSQTGLMRQIQYKLVDGEAMRQFKIDKVVEF
ncbi:hypothetical protein OO013_04290 [Mangrovivirga sp. M17]|uniref:Uncharacterized protein n=1 Tax=Mangrovivirga halotolerans TaxID=2993936 RepID=A0ABT3RMM6_9BACT|nr:hypothetical protein [Mangrovivirga halotolerans]MCX2743069.1 hypothetical protein [Mangrovivirga halotolerans]